MKAIDYHIKGILGTFEQLFKGRFLIYFVPGIVVAGFFWYLLWKASSVEESFDFGSEYDWLNWVGGVVDTGVSTAFGILDVLLEQAYIFIVLTVLSPFNTALGEKLDEQLTGRKATGGIIRFLNDLIRMVFIVIIALVLEFFFMGVYWMLSFVLGIPDVVDPYVYYAIQAFFFGFAFYDFALERYAKGVFGTLGFAFARPLGMIITGSLFLAIYNIPIAGVVLAPVLCVMISTVAYLYYTEALPIVKKSIHE